MINSKSKPFSYSLIFCKLSQELKIKKEQKIFMNQNYIIWFVFWHRGRIRGLMINVMDCDIVVSEFER